MIKIYRFRKAYHFTDRFSREYLQSNGIIFTKNLLAADVLLLNTSGLRSYTIAKKIFFFKKLIVWTNEPRIDCVLQNFKSRNRIIMNVYSGNIFFHNLHFLGSYHYIFSYNLGIDLFAPPGTPLTRQRLAERKKFCVCVFGYRDPEKSEWLIDKTNADLFVRRQELATFLYKHNKADIIGNNWPGPVKILETSGFENGEYKWWSRKMDILKDYKFNLCFENTIAPYYCTEKIWHAIAAGCLPVYYGKGTAIYETFPVGSFIDASEFECHEDLLYFLETISVEEHINRYNSCLAVMHKCCAARIENPFLKTDIIDQFIDNVQHLAGKLNDHAN